MMPLDPFMEDSSCIINDIITPLQRKNKKDNTHMTRWVFRPLTSELSNMRLRLSISVHCPGSGRLTSMPRVYPTPELDRLRASTPPPPPETTGDPTARTAFSSFQHFSASIVLYRLFRLIWSAVLLRLSLPFQTSKPSFSFLHQQKNTAQWQLRRQASIHPWRTVP